MIARNLNEAVENGTRDGQKFTSEEFLADAANDLRELAGMSRIALQQLWASIRARTDLPVIPADWLTAGANGTGYFDNILEMGVKIPLGVFFKGTDHSGRMVVICRPVSSCEPICFFDRYSGADQQVICQQRRGGGALVDCNGDAPRMVIDLLEALSQSGWYNTTYLSEQTAA